MEMEMKTTLVFVLATALSIVGVNCAPRTVSKELPDVATAMIANTEAYNHMSRCGDPEMDIPVQEPLRMPIVTLDIDHELLVLNGSIENVVLIGLSDFIIIDMKTSATTNRTTYDVMYRDLQVLGEYNLYVTADLAGYKLLLNLTGLMNIAAKDLRINGGFTINPSDVGGIVISDTVTYFQLGSLVSEILDAQFSVALGDFFNEFVQEAVMVYVKTRREFLNELVSSSIQEQANEVLYNVTLNDYIQKMVNNTEAWNAISCNA